MGNEILKWYFSNFRTDDQPPDVAQLVVILQAMGFKLKVAYGPKRTGSFQKECQGCCIIIRCRDSNMGVLLESPKCTRCMCPTEECPSHEMQKSEPKNFTSQILSVPKISESTNKFVGGVLKSLTQLIHTLECGPIQYSKTRDCHEGLETLICTINSMQHLESLPCGHRSAIRDPDLKGTVVPATAQNESPESFFSCKISPIKIVYDRRMALSSTPSEQGVAAARRAICGTGRDKHLPARISVLRALAVRPAPLNVSKAPRKVRSETRGMKSGRENAGKNRPITGTIVSTVHAPARLKARKESAVGSGPKPGGKPSHATTRRQIVSSTMISGSAIPSGKSSIAAGFNLIKSKNNIATSTPAVKRK